MSVPLSATTSRLTMRRVLPVPVEQVFRAWTEPRELQKWFGVAEGYTTPIAEVDLRVGGRYRLGMLAPGATEINVAEGEYREIIPPRKLVFTWRWKDSPPEQAFTLVTVELFAHEDATELVLTHEGFKTEPERALHLGGWEGCIAQLEKCLATKDKLRRPCAAT